MYLNVHIKAYKFAQAKGGCIKHALNEGASASGIFVPAVADPGKGR